MGKESIAFIGTGVKGASIVKHLLKNGRVKKKIGNVY